MRLASLAAALLALLAGCSDPAAPAGDGRSTTPNGTSGATAGTEPGTSGTSCPTASGRGPEVAPKAAYRRGSDPARSAEAFARKVVEAAGDRLEAASEAAQLEGRNAPRAWQTRDGWVEVFWAKDEAAWSAEHVLTLHGAPSPREAAGRAVLRALGAEAGATWTGTADAASAHRDVHGLPLPLVTVTDQPMEAEQTSFVRRVVAVSPDYEAPAEVLGGAAAAGLAAQHAACRGHDGFGFDAVHARFAVHEGRYVYWFDPQPDGGWTAPCTLADQGRLHLAVDAVTGALASIDLRCGDASAAA